MKKTYNAPAAKIVKIHPRNLMHLSNGGNAKLNGIKQADSRSLRYDVWDDGGDYNDDSNDDYNGEE